MAMFFSKPKTEQKPLTEYDLQYAIIQNWNRSGNFFCPNISSGFGEMDVLRLTRSGYAYEFEVKISRADFRADKKKEYKHKNYSDMFNKIPLTGIGRYSVENVPNYFYYVAPKGIIPVDEVPAYAGLYEIKENPLWLNYLDCIKVAPLIHKEKYPDVWRAIMLNSLNAKYFYHYWFKLKKEQ